MDTDSQGEGPLDLGILADLLRRLTDDWNRNDLRDLAHYQAAYPGYEASVEAEYRAFLATEPEPSIESPKPSPSSEWQETLPNRIGPFRVLDLLGKGGQGIVYRARDTRLGRDVALKLLTTSRAATLAERQRFQREAEVAARIDHPSIASVLESGFHEGVPYIAMRYVEGRTLAEILSEERATQGSRSDSSRTREEQTRIANHILLLSKVARAIHIAHAAGVVHRDLKPANIMVTSEGEPVILDFGLASDASDADASLTATGDVFGTPSYMSPEQVRGERVDPRTDIYSLGVILHECTLSARPFVGLTREQLVQSILHREVSCMAEARRAHSSDLGAVLEACLQKERNRRYHSAEDLAADLLCLTRNEPVRVKPISALGRVYRSARRRPLVTTLSLLLALSLLSLAGFFGFLAAKSRALTVGEKTLRSEKLNHLLQDAYLDLGEGDRSRAIEKFEAIRSEFTASREAIVGLSLGELFEGRPENALAALTYGATRDDAEFSELVHLIAERAPSLFLEPVNPPLSVSTPLACFIRGVIHVMKGHEGDASAFPRAQTFLEQAMILSENSNALYVFEWAHAVGHTRDRKAAELVSVAIEQRWPDAALGHFWAGFAWHGLDALRAAAHLEKAVALDPTCGIAWHGYGNILSELGRLQDAQRAYERSCEFFGETAAPWNSLGSVLPEEGDESVARGHFEKAIAIDPRCAPAYVNLAALHHRQGRFDDAQKAITEALSIDDSDAIAWFNQGIIAFSRDDRKQATVSFRRAAALAPSDARARQQLADLLLKDGDSKGAILVLNQCLAAGHTDAAIHARLGDALMGVSDFAAAAAAYEKALALEPENATILARSAVPALKSMEFSKAIAVLEAASDLNAEDPVVKQLSQLLLPFARRGAQVEKKLLGFAKSGDVPAGIFFKDLLAVADQKGWCWTILRLVKSTPKKDDVTLEQRLTMLSAVAACVENRGRPSDPAPRESEEQVRSVALEQLRVLLDDLNKVRERGPLKPTDRHVLTSLAESESLNPYRQSVEHWPLALRLPWATEWQRLEALLASESQ